MIEIINDMDRELLEKVSPSSRTVKNFIKVPLVFLVWASSMQSSLSVIMLKLFGELIQSGSSGTYWFLMIFLVVMMFLSSLMQIHIINLAMKYYDQVEVVPIFQTCLMIMWITSGLIVLNEKKFYSWLELAGILGSIVLSLIGIKFLSMKRKLIKIEAKRERASSLNSQFAESEMTPKDQSQTKQMMFI